MTGDEPVWTPAAAAAGGAAITRFAARAGERAGLAVAGADAVDDFAALAQFTVYAGGPDRRGSGR
jgi:hypothetical protein